MSDNNNNCTDEERRRKQEMNMFAAFATRGEASIVGAHVDASSSNPFDRSSFRVEPKTSEPTTRPSPEPQRSGKDNNFLAAARGRGGDLPDSGSFAVQNTSSTTWVGAAEQSNLSAAVAALSKDDNSSNAAPLNTGNQTIHHNAEAPRYFRNNRASASKKTKDNKDARSKDPSSIPEDQIPMFAEEVVMPRPLFFGALVPPRVLQEARLMVQTAVRKTGSQHPRLHELPVSVRNLVGTLRTYGYGLHELLEPLASFATVDNNSRHTSFAEDAPNTIDGDYQTVGDPHLTTFQPVWGSDVRATRVREFCTQRAARKVRKPSIVSRVSTAPPRMLLAIDDDDDDDSDDDIDTGHDVRERPVVVTGYKAAADFPEPSEVQPGQAVSASSLLPTKEQQSSSSQTSQPLNDNEQFSAWIQSDDDSLSGNESAMDSPSPATEESRTTELSEQKKFSQWALGSKQSSASNTAKPKSSTDTFQFTSPSKAGNVDNAYSTFQRLPTAVDSDDDSLIDDEQKKQVGVSESLSKAVALLAEQDGEETAPANADALVEHSVLLSQVPLDWTRRRPLTNYELTSGCVPLFGIDDSPLPQESDLGIHETKEEVQRAMEQKRSQEIIEKFVPRNFFGPVACPNPAINPDDFHSWNSRTTTSSSSSAHNATRFISGSSIASDPVGINRRAQYGTASSDPLGRNSITPSNNNGPPPKPPKHKSTPAGKESSTAPMKKLLQTTRQRFGWWSQGPPTDHDNSKGQHQRPKDTSTPEDKDAATEEDLMEESDEQELQLPPIQHSSATLQVVTPLEPSMEQLRNDNLPLSRMHAATTMAQTLPYLSDRPPSYRYLQIDTQLVTFAPIRAEIEPLFCSLALYNVETVSSGISTGSSKNAAPIPDMQRCGRVTEALYFDHVQDPEVETRCRDALWPYSEAKCNETGGNHAGAVSVDSSDSLERLRGTKCGVFPIPSNLNVANVYAVLIVHKVFSDESDLDPYLKPGKPISDLERLKYNAAKNAAKRGNFVVPFAFGVAPLLQVFGTDNPMVASSRAVQIPLFHFSDGERQIIDHIMVMLFPRADHRANGVGGPAPVTNGGIAMLVMRNFGYLGLHAVVDSKSSLARDRLVDFTGELQLRRQTEEDSKVEFATSARRTRLEPINYRLKLPKWHPNFVAEPTMNGGRILVGPVKSVEPRRVNDSKHYAQELAPLPLMLAPTDRLTENIQPGMSHNDPQQDDIEPLYHTSFCNELLCHPRILHNCPRGTIAIKVELRDVQWNEDSKAYFAHLPGPTIGPSIHNPRRGPFLVQSAFTSCTPRRSEHQFMDEFKLKLPLDLQQADENGRERNLCLFFTVYRLKRRSNSMWKRGAKMLFGSNAGGTSDPNAADGLQIGGVDPVASGFLPITAQSCLIDNGLYDVRIGYKARAIGPEESNHGSLPVTSLVLVETSVTGDAVYNAAGRDESIAEDTTISNDSFKSDRNRAAKILENADSDTLSCNEDSQLKGGKTKTSEPMSLSVRVVVYSSLHTQNAALNQLLNQESDLPVMSYLPNKVFMATLRMGREYLAGNAYLVPSRRIARDREYAMVEPTIAITDHQVCSVPQLTGHMLRILPALWRSLVCGDGEPDLVWANPGASTPLRVQSFATILHLVGATALYMSRNGVTQVNGTSKWNVVIFGRVLALVFDERHLFGDQSVEKFDEKYWLDLAEKSGSNSHPAKKSQPKRRGHVRSTYDLGNDIGPSKGQSSVVSNISSDAGDLVTLPKRVQPERENLVAAFEIDMRGSDDSDEQRSPDALAKVDTKSDFQSFLRAANASFDDDLDKISVGAGRRSKNASGSAAASAFAKAFSGMSTCSKFSTAPPLHTILEGGDDTSSNLTELGYIAPSSGIADGAFDAGNDGIVSNVPTRPTKTMRVPRLRKGGSLNVDVEKQLTNEKQDEAAPIVPKVPKSSEEIEKLGEGFLDSIGASLGLSNTVPDPNGEEERVGSSHHRRKTRGRSSIDWSLLPGLDEKTATANSGGQDDVTISSEGTTDESDEHMSTLKSEESSCVTLPTYVDRLVIIGDSSPIDARWFPYTYEVVIMQWAAVLFEQRKVGEKKPASRTTGDQSTGQSTPPHYSNGNLSHAALRCVGVAVAGAPLLFEVIKKSLGFRVHKLFDRILSKSESRNTPPLVSLDEALLTNLVQVVSMVTDACIDSRNFDTWDLRQMSIDVNDSIVRFLRDMFSFLAPTCVHRLVLAYLSRFVTKEGKYSTDRDSLIGLRCSWEITKLRLNAVTALIRFPDFIKINGPQMLNWSNWWTNSRSRSNPKFYDNVLHRYENFRLPGFVTNEAGVRKDVVVASMRPHWLAEIVVDICLLGTEHAEQYIHHRSASLLHELFWACSQESTLYGISAPVGAMFATYLEKLIPHASYLSNFAPKSQLRKDVLSACVFVLQSTPPNLLRALWRKLFSRLSGKGLNRKYAIVMDHFGYDSGDESTEDMNTHSEAEPDIIGMISLLNLTLRTIEYEGSDENLDSESSGDSRNNLDLWRKEFLLSRPPVYARQNRGQETPSDDEGSTSTSRKWQAHDGSMVIVNAAHQIVREVYTMLNKSQSGKALLNPAVRGYRRADHHDGPISRDAAESAENLTLSRADIVLFIRAVTSLYLHALALRESDIVIAKSFIFSAEVIKIFGIKLFLEAVGETHQHWMRVISLNCGARRAQVRIEATDLLELVLRSTWECYGSFFRIRLPLLAVQTEVMERIVATAAARYYRDQRRLGVTDFENFTNVGAEASLVPLWRTLDRIQKQPASQNVAFRGALIRIAGKLKKLYRAYVAARVLSFIKSYRNRPPVEENPEERNFEEEAIVRANRISILRVINASEGHSKQFLGFQGTTLQRSSVAHFEAVEDALIDAANVFSPTELPEHRVAWLRMLAEFHKSRNKFAEEATCHYQIHVTLHLAARLHGSLWSNTPFLPWTDNIPDPVVYIDADASPGADPDYQESELNFDGDDWEYSGQAESAISFRRIFYRVANSITMGNAEYDVGGSRSLFYGVTFLSEYLMVSPWISLREMEENMVEEVETAGSLFLKAGIVESSRYSWNLATQYYADKFNYAKLQDAYGNLAEAMVSQVPFVDTSLPQEVSAILGRFYRVWFHGGAPDELSGVEFVYRTQGNVRLHEFGEELRTVIQTIVPNKTPIRLILDGYSDERVDDTSASYSGFRIGPAPLEPVHIKVTPLRPRFDRDTKTRGLPEWFNKYAAEAFSGQKHLPKSEFTENGKRLRRRTESILSTVTGGAGDQGGPVMMTHEHTRSFAATIFSSGGSSAAPAIRKSVRQNVNDADRLSRFNSPLEPELSGVDKFCFVQPKNRSRPKEWWKASFGNLAEKSLRVTQLQVAESFPACVSRQEVVHRLVYLQSPLEAGIDAMCQWCAVLFRTAVATSGMHVLKTNHDPGIGTDAAKVVADCIHNSHVKDIGLTLLKKHSENETNQISDFAMDSGQLADDEIEKLQIKLARLIITFVELLHLLIARNRDKLLRVIKERKRNEASGSVHGGASSVGVPPPPTSRGNVRHSSVGNYYENSSGGRKGGAASFAETNRLRRGFGGDNRSDTNRSDDLRGFRSQHTYAGSEDNQSHHSINTTSGVRTDSAIAVQSELQRAFISLCKVLYKSVQSVMQKETPRWFKQSGQDNYFSLGTYKQTVIPIAEELCFNAIDSSDSDSQHPFHHQSQSVYSEPGYDESPRDGSIAGGSQVSVASRGSDRFEFGQI